MPPIRPHGVGDSARRLGVRYLVAAIVGYAVGWTGGYLSVMGADFAYFFEYLGLAWSGGGERPMIIQVAALSVATVAVVGCWAVGRKRRPEPAACGDGQRPSSPRLRDRVAWCVLATPVAVLVSELAWPSDTDSPWSYGWRLLLGRWVPCAAVVGVVSLLLHAVRRGAR